MLTLSDDELLAHLTAFGDHFTERKPANDSKGWLPCVVAFANSVPVGYPAVLFIGVGNDGSIEETINPDSLQKTLSKELADAYPPIYYLPKVMEHGGRKFLAVIVPGSADRPHFSGPAYIRDGLQTKIGSEPEFQQLIAERSSKAYEILKWLGKEIVIETPNRGPHGGVSRASAGGVLIDCNAHYATVDISQNLISCPLARLNLSFDNKHQCLKLEVHEL